MHTHRLDLEDPTLREWDATVLASSAEDGIVLDRSAFYPGGGGQPPAARPDRLAMSARAKSRRPRERSELAARGDGWPRAERAG